MVSSSSSAIWIKSFKGIFPLSHFVLFLGCISMNCTSSLFGSKYALVCPMAFRMCFFVEKKIRPIHRKRENEADSCTVSCIRNWVLLFPTKIHSLAIPKDWSCPTISTERPSHWLLFLLHWIILDLGSSFLGNIFQQVP